MSYTPDTTVIHACYLACTDWESWAAYEGKNISELSKERDAEFDRWLAEVKAQAWEEGYAHGNADAFTEARLDRDNPYREVG